MLSANSIHVFYRGEKEIASIGANIFHIYSEDGGSNWINNGLVELDGDDIMSFKGPGAIWINDTIYFMFAYHGDFSLSKLDTQDEFQSISKFVLGSLGDNDVDLASFGSEIVAGITYNSIVNYAVSSDNGKTWKIIQSTGEHTDKGVALCEFNDKIFLAYVGIDSNEICWITSSDLDTKKWSGKKTTGQQTGSPCSLCVFKDDLYMAYRGKNSNELIVLKYLSDADEFFLIGRLGDTTNAGVALVSNDKYLYLFFDGEHSSELEFRKTEDVVNWDSKKSTGQKGGARSALVIVPST